ELTPGPNRGEPVWIRGGRLAREADVVRELRDFRLQRAGPLRELGEWFTTCQRRDRGTQRVFDRTGKLFLGAGERITMRVGIGKHALFTFEACFFVVVLEDGRVDLRELVTQQVCFARPGAFVAAETFEFGVDVVHLGPRDAQLP